MHPNSESLFDIERTLEIPAQISSLDLDPSGFLLVGSVDGSLRQYNTSTWKVNKAIRALGGEISSIVQVPSPNQQIWLACEQEALCFSITTEKMLLTRSDATFVIKLCDGDDVLNQLSLNDKNTHLAFCTDSGTIAVLDLHSRNVASMRTSHASICGSVSFVPDRPRELVSGGYDAALLHHDFETRSLLSRREFTNQLSTDGVSMSPPFIISMAMSTTGILAAGTADGQLWVGLGGEKLSGSQRSNHPKQKKSKKWGGFKEGQEIVSKIAEGPVVALTFADSSTLLASTLHGRVICYNIEREEPGRLVEQWCQTSLSVSKVNVLARNNDRLFLGGVGHQGKGCLEIYRQSHS